MKKLVILVLILTLFSLNVYGDNFNLQVSFQDKKVTWNNIFYEEPECTTDKNCASDDILSTLKCGVSGEG